MEIPLRPKQALRSVSRSQSNLVKVVLGSLWILAGYFYEVVHQCWRQHLTEFFAIKFRVVVQLRLSHVPKTDRRGGINELVRLSRIDEEVGVCQRGEDQVCIL